MFPAVKNKYIKPIKTQFRGLGLGYTFRLGYMPYKTGKGIMYLISRKIEFKFSFQPEKFFFSVKSHFSFLFGVFLAFLVSSLSCHVIFSVQVPADSPLSLPLHPVHTSSGARPTGRPGLVSLEVTRETLFIARQSSVFVSVSGARGAARPS